ncbi:MAG: hypothetical protein UW64_C0019G0012 [Microgenomates group bacterium GW2011_GWC1_44_37]|uniref:Uncharacterized protein n=1 Tax=Candidatus Collierbacteria bacterium GW2011_GWB2_44_22 TaxID=1618387 RepID=A0A0G1K453_9BACT|nr:MAG: hypothetical protein UW44_C0017G0012 [Candidatus Collierbacteria bacterium GW2011_GWB2_44_22]KKT64611.1 MAG: hypothetical protein UW58_C0039G0010 [Candidatus Collierbacteria bacterium GW2011_GWC2_44_30]KKT68435.1 MAG: hypothetical protein UW64_C0019G0012 [Microgenomates group bacterium GW2011_GWC1_44_37]
MNNENNFKTHTSALSYFEKIAQSEKARFLCTQRIFRCKTGRILRWQNCDPFFKKDEAQSRVKLFSN